MQYKKIQNKITRMKFWMGKNNSSRKPINLFRNGKCLSRNFGIGIPARLWFALLKNSFTAFNRGFNFSSSCLKRSPPITDHKIFRSDKLNNPLKSTNPFEVSAWILISSIKSPISSWIRFSEDVLPNPKSRKWRWVKRRCSCHISPSVKFIPEGKVFNKNIITK